MGKPYRTLDEVLAKLSGEVKKELARLLADESPSAPIQIAPEELEPYSEEERQLIFRAAELGLDIRPVSSS